MYGMSDAVDNRAAEFRYIIQGLSISIYSGNTANSTYLAALLARCWDLAKCLPHDMDALSCALEFAEAYLPQYASDRAVPGYETPDWLLPPGPSDWRQEPEEELVDGQWAVVNPAWEGLPGDRSADLNLMASLRAKSKQTVKDLAAQANVTDTTIRRRLIRLEGLGFVTKSDTRPEHYSLVDPLPK
jgi:hypothetical protein